MAALKLRESEASPIAALPDHELWLSLLKLQTSMYQPAELSFLYQSAEWKTARRVLDMGCGPGYFTAALAERFPEKDFVGIDLNPDYIDVAATHGPLNARFYEGDVAQLEAHGFDFIILRFVAQHLPNNREVLARIRDSASPGTTIAFIEPQDRLVFSEPALSEHARMYEVLAEAQKKRGGGRDVLDDLATLGAELGFTVGRSLESSIPLTSCVQRDQFERLYGLVGEIVSRKFSADFDKGLLIKQLAEWKRNPRSFAQLGVRFLELKTR